MEGEFNELNYNNANITFSTSTNNIATSDELSAALLYQDKMGTNYSKSKKISKAVAATGIALLVTAASIRAGTVITNGFVLNPPKATIQTAEIVEGSFHYIFKLENPRGYKTQYFISVNGETKLQEDCTESKDYEGTFDEFVDGDKCEFYISFTNQIDYTKRVKTIRFNKGGVTL